MNFPVALAIWINNVVLAAGLVSAATAANLSPVPRVIKLLNEMQQELEVEMKQEADLFGAYRCWKKKVVSTKIASNTAAASRVDALKSYISQLAGGKITLTTEEGSLKKQIDELTKDSANAQLLRDNEHKDFIAAKSEMTAAISALGQAIKELRGAKRNKKLAALSEAMRLGQNIMDKSELNYMEEFLKKPNWNINKKATFKMKYDPSSGPVVKTLSAMNTMFNHTLRDATVKEAKAAANFVKLKASKDKLLRTSKKSLKDMKIETGARAVAKNTADNEMTALSEQVKQDAKFLKQVKIDFLVKEGDFNARTKLRTAELGAISKAISILDADDAKDAFKASFGSSAMLLQQSAVQHQASGSFRAKVKTRLLASLASGSIDAGLALTAKRAGVGGLGAVVQQIDKILAAKAREGHDDRVARKKCQKDIAGASKSARSSSLAVDSLSEAIARAKSKVGELKKQNAELLLKKKDVRKQLQQLAQQRKQEKKATLRDQQVDFSAASQIASAKRVLMNWKPGKAAGLMTLSSRVQSAAPSLDGAWEAAGGQKVTIAGKKLTWGPKSWDLSAITANSFKISGGFGSGGGIYNALTITWKNGLVFTRLSMPGLELPPHANAIILEGPWEAPNGALVSIAKAGNGATLTWKKLTWKISKIGKSTFAIDKGFGGGSATHYDSRRLVWGNKLVFVRPKKWTPPKPVVPNAAPKARKFKMSNAAPKKPKFKISNAPPRKPGLKISKAPVKESGMGSMVKASPPPTTWVSPYRGSNMHKGIIGILTMIEEDIKGDIQASKDQEKNAVLEYAQQKKALEGEITAIDSTTDAYSKEIAAQAKRIAEKSTERSTKNQNVISQIKLHKDLRPGCDFVMLNFDMRRALRHVEMKNLRKVKRQLQSQVKSMQKSPLKSPLKVKREMPVKRKIQRTNAAKKPGFKFKRGKKKAKKIAAARAKKAKEAAAKEAAEHAEEPVEEHVEEPVEEHVEEHAEEMPTRKKPSNNKMAKKEFVIKGKTKKKEMPIEDEYQESGNELDDEPKSGDIKGKTKKKEMPIEEEYQESGNELD